MTATVTTASDGTTNVFAVPFPYFDEADVDVFVDGVLFAGTVTWLSSSEIALDPIPAAGGQVTRSRATPLPPKRQFVYGPVVSADLNANQTQDLYLVEELQDQANRAFSVPLGEPGLVAPKASLRRNALAFFADTAQAALTAITIPALIVLLGEMFKGNPGESANNTGLFTALATQNIDPAITRLTTSGHTQAATGGTSYIVDPNQVDGAGATLYRIKSADGRWWTIDPSVQHDVTHFGALPGMASDSTDAGDAAVVWHAGKVVRYPAGIWRRTRPVDYPAVNTVNIHGDVSAYRADSWGVLKAFDSSSLYNQTPASVDPSLIEGLAIIVCDGCNLSGKPDTSGVSGVGDKLRSLRNIVSWGVNGSKIGVYRFGENADIKGCMFVLHEWFGILSRGMGLANITDIIYQDCGWNLDATGALTGYPTGAYVSGCALRVCSNGTALDYTSIDLSYRPTSSIFLNQFVSVRGHTAANKSGIRGFQLQGFTNLQLANVGGFTGHLIELSSVVIGSHHIENYAAAGAAAGDGTPYGIIFKDSMVDMGDGYRFNANGPANHEVLEINSDVANSPHSVIYRRAGNVLQDNGPFRPTQILSQTIAVTSATTVTYTFPGFLTSTRGFFGKAYVSLVRIAAPATRSRAHFTLGAHRVGSGPGYTVDTPSADYSYQTGSGTTGAAITLTFVGADLVMTVAWGSGYSTGDTWKASISLQGVESYSI